MKKFHLVVCFIVLFSTSALYGEESAGLWTGKVIFINQYNQKITPYLDGKQARESMETITGDAKCPTPQGIYRVERKVRKYWSKRYGVWMIDCLFFIWTDESHTAIHRGEVPPAKKRKGLATGGCPHLRKQDNDWLYQWAEEKTTKVIVFGDRSQD